MKMKIEPLNNLGKAVVGRHANRLGHAYQQAQWVQPPKELMEYAEHIAEELQPDLGMGVGWLRQTQPGFAGEGITFRTKGVGQGSVIVLSEYEAFNRHTILHEFTHATQPSDAAHTDKFYVPLLEHVINLFDDPILAANIEFYQPNPQAFAFARAIDPTITIEKSVAYMQAIDPDFPPMTAEQAIMYMMLELGIIKDDYGTF